MGGGAASRKAKKHTQTRSAHARRQHAALSNTRKCYPNRTCLDGALLTHIIYIHTSQTSLSQKNAVHCFWALSI